MGHGPKVAVELQHSETALLAAASRIHAARIAAGEVDPGNEDEALEHAVQTAVKMALRIDRLVQSDDEISSLRRRGPA